MANLYGVANAPSFSVFANTIGSANIACPASTNTPIITTTAIVAPSQGYFYVLAWINAEVLIGATPPTSLTFTIAIGAGSFVNGVGPAGSMIASTTELVSAATFSANSQVAWISPGSTVSIACNPFAQPVTVNNAGTWAMFTIMRAPDQ